MEKNFRMGQDKLTGRFVPIEETHDVPARYTVVEFDKKLKEFRDLVYEPEHEKGGVCWCGVTFSKETDHMEITHKAQRDTLTDFVHKNFRPTNK